MIADTETRREVTLTRLIDAPRELVFKAWTDAKLLAQWWGPRGFTAPTCKIDAKKGGMMHIVMRAPDGHEFPMEGTIREIVSPERIVFTNTPVDSSGDHLIEGITTVTFESVGNKTKLTLHTSAVALKPEAVPMLQGMEQGWTETIDRMEEFVTKT